MSYRYVLSSLAVLAWCGWVRAAEAVSEPKVPEDPLILAVAAATTDFAADVYGQLRFRPGNLAFSPLCLAQALLPVAAGAGGPTADELLRALHVGIPLAEAGDGFELLGRRWDHEAGGEKRMGTARSLWLQQWNAVEPDFIEKLRRHCRCEFRVIDFGRRAHAAHWINRWVSDRTGDRVRAIATAEGLADRTSLFVGTAVYFRADWQVDFDPASTAMAPFSVPVSADPMETERAAGQAASPTEAAAVGSPATEPAEAPGSSATPDAGQPVGDASDGAVANDDTAVTEPAEERGATLPAVALVEVPTMRQVAMLRTAAAGGFRMVQIPYRNGRLALVVLLPENVDSLATAEAGVSGERVRTCLARLEGAAPAWVDLQLPRFNIEQVVPRLDEALRAIGITTAFDQEGSADFSGIGTNLQGEPMYLSTVGQIVKLAVDERGVESGAVVPAAIPFDRPVDAPQEFRVDRPFLFLVCDRLTGSLLFLGRIVDPRRS